MKVSRLECVIPEFVSEQSPCSSSSEKSSYTRFVISLSIVLCKLTYILFVLYGYI